MNQLNTKAEPNEIIAMVKNNAQGYRLKNKTRQIDTTTKIMPRPSSSPLVTRVFRLGIVVALVLCAVPVAAQGWSVIAWTGSLDHLPDGWQLCDGSNGTPDLQNRFLVGAGDSYTLAFTGGVITNTTRHRHQVTSHNHTIPTDAACPTITTGRAAPELVGFGMDVVTGVMCNGHDHGSNVGYASPRTDYQGDDSLENRPPFYSIYYVCARGLPGISASEPYTFTTSSGEVIEIQRQFSYSSIAIIALLVLFLLVLLGCVFWLMIGKGK